MDPTHKGAKMKLSYSKQESPVVLQKQDIRNLRHLVSDGEFITALTVIALGGSDGGLPKPTIKSIAEVRGKGITTIQKHLRSMRNNDLLIAERDSIGGANTYDFRPLYEKLIDLR